MPNKNEKIAVFYKFSAKSFGSSQKSSTFAPAKQKCMGVWCNGNTADSGPAFPGSSPGTPTEKKVSLGKPFFVLARIANQHLCRRLYRRYIHFVSSGERGVSVAFGLSATEFLAQIVHQGRIFAIVIL